MKHDPKDPLGCQCETCRVIYAEADDLAAKLWKSIPTCKREGCKHNNCVFVDGMCAGDCGCKP